MTCSILYSILDALEHGIGVFGLWDLRRPLRHHGPRELSTIQMLGARDLGPETRGMGDPVHGT